MCTEASCKIWIVALNFVQNLLCETHVCASRADCPRFKKRVHRAFVQNMHCCTVSCRIYIVKPMFVHLVKIVRAIKNVCTELSCKSCLVAQSACLIFLNLHCFVQLLHDRANFGCTKLGANTHRFDLIQLIM